MGWVPMAMGAFCTHACPKVRNPIPLGYGGFCTVYYKDIGEFQILYSLRPKLLDCFKKSQCLKLGGWFPNLSNKEFFFKSNRTDGKRHYQLAYIPNSSQFQHTMTKIITHLDAKI
jgi:hypothetical protein